MSLATLAEFVSPARSPCMFGLIGHSTSLEEARAKARSLGYEEYADGDLDMWCSAPPQMVETIAVTSRTGQSIQGAYIDSVFVPEMLRRFKTAKRKVLKAMELALWWVIQLN